MASPAARRGKFQIDIARAVFDQLVEPARAWFDVDPIPALFVEKLGDRMIERVVRTDVDIEAILNIFEGTMKADVLQELSV